MEEQYKKILSEEFSPLIPYELIEEYKDYMDSNLREVLRSNCLRRYLEGSIDLLLKEKIISLSNLNISKWNNYDLNNKVQAIGKYYDKGIETEFHKLRKIGNGGSHYGNKVSKEELKEGISIATRIVEMVLIKYFKDYPIGSQLPVMTMLSALPPRHRVFILEALWEDGQKNYTVIDKLSMAYLKSGQYSKSLNFLDELKNDKLLSQEEHQQFVSKINSLNEGMDKFDISKNVLDVKRIFDRITNDIDYSQYEEFTKIILVLVSGYNINE